jgi:hypothetical protein
MASTGTADEALALQRALRHALVPHEGGQKEVLDDEHRFQVLTAGRRFGKTKLGARRLIRKALAEPNQLIWWVANFYENTRRGFREVVKQLPPQLLAKPAPASTSNTLRLVLKNGSVIEFYSAANPDAMVGAGVDYMVIDEAALVEERVWFQQLRSTLMDSGGGALIISTPRGRNWFWQLWTLGQKNSREYKSWRFTSYDNPYIPDDEIDELKQTLPELVFLQEVMAEFVDDAATIFKLGDSVLPALADPKGHLYLGIDLAKKEDFTVITADREDGLPCWYQRLTERPSWGVQKAIIAETIDSLLEERSVTGATIGVDSTGLGDVIYDDLVDMGYDVIPIAFTQPQKERMVRRLAGDIEHGRAWIIEEMRDEFEAYEYEITSLGRFKFEAATGHDDKVSAKMLAHWTRVVEGIPQVALGGDAGEPMEEEGEAEELVADPAQSLMNRPEVWSSHGASSSY